MKLWSKTLIASAVCLFLAGCDDSSKVDASLKVYYNISDDELLIDNKGNRIDSFMQENIKLLKQKEGSKYANGPTNIFDCISLFKSKRFKKFVKIIMK